MTKPPPEVLLMRLGNAFQLSRALQVAASLDLGRRLDGGPQSVAELARVTSTEARALERLLRFLAEIGVVEELDDGRFGPTALSQDLHLVDNIAQGDEAWAAWGALPEALRTGEAVFESVHGATFYDYAARHPEKEARWCEWNHRIGGTWYPAVADALTLGGSETVVDVGGGQGHLLAEVLARHPDCRGVLFDLPSVVQGSAEVLADLAGRFEAVGGDAREGVPAGGDVYLLSRVLLNCGDEDARRLLRACRAAMGGPQSRLLVVETLMPERGDPRRRAMAAHDLNLLVLWGGGHRTRGEVVALLEAAGLALASVHDDPAGWSIVEARIDAASS